MDRTLLFVVAIAMTACAGSAPHGTESPANPRAATGAAPPAYTSLSSSDTPGIVAEPSASPSNADHAHESPGPSIEPASSAPPHEEHAASEAPSGSPVDAERAAFEQARPVFDRYCSACHTSRGARHTATTLRHFSMDRYPFGGHHTATMGPTIREVLGAAGEPATMPADQPGAVRGDDLARVLAWADAWEHARGAVPSASTAPAAGAGTAHSHHHKLEQAQ
jgi:hypothetical protein